MKRGITIKIGAEIEQNPEDRRPKKQLMDRIQQDLENLKMIEYEQNIQNSDYWITVTTETINLIVL